MVFFSVPHMAVTVFLAFKDLYIQTNFHKFLKKLYKTMHFDLHA